MNPKIKIGALSISDRASQGEYIDKGIPTIQQWLNKTITTPFDFVSKIIPDEINLIESALIELSDIHKCNLIFTTGGTGPTKRDVTPEATINICDKQLPGFGEQMRQVGLHFVPTAILSRQTAVIRGKCLIVNLPGQPKSITQTFEGVKDENGQTLISGIFASIPYCVELICSIVIHTNPKIVKSFRPKSAKTNQHG